MIPMRWDRLAQVLDAVFDAPQMTIADIAYQLRKMMRSDPIKAEYAVGTLYGQVFKRKEAALNPWTPPEQQ